MIAHAALPEALLDELVRRALTEDLGERGDITTAATVAADITGRFRIVARRPGILAGARQPSSCSVAWIRRSNSTGSSATATG